MVRGLYGTAKTEFGAPRIRVLPADYFLGTEEEVLIPESTHTLSYLPVFGHLPPLLDDEEARFLKRDMRGKIRTSVFSKPGILRATEYYRCFVCIGIGLY